MDVLYLQHFIQFSPEITNYHLDLFTSAIIHAAKFYHHSTLLSLLSVIEVARNAFLYRYRERHGFILRQSLSRTGVR